MKFNSDWVLVSAYPENDTVICNLENIKTNEKVIASIDDVYQIYGQRIGKSLYWIEKYQNRNIASPLLARLSYQLGFINNTEFHFLNSVRNNVRLTDQQRLYLSDINSAILSRSSKFDNFHNKQYKTPNPAF